MGPTASGKTDLALALHERLPLDIVSVDSAMVYRGMDIGTAKPSREVLTRVPHRLIDICDPAEAYSAGRFRADAREAIRDIHAAGRIPLLVGGTGLYFRSLEQGFSRLPPSDPAVRDALEEEADLKGWKQMYALLAQIDPISAKKIHPNDPQRIQRALEVYRITGRPLSSLVGGGREGGLDSPLIKLVVAPAERSRLHEVIRRRFLGMLEAELMAEVRCLYERGDLHAGLPAMRLVGYRQAWQYLAGELDYNSMINKAITATRQLAKRQLTWLRAEPDARWFNSDSGRLEERVLNFLRKDPVFS
ncbi:MAG: tRNA (adenosine(37)-N6)-dimethylallyltransferase MiaA [Gammaproteobacteria bacterium]